MTDVLAIPHERVMIADVARPWQHLFIERALRLRLQSGETVLLMAGDVETILPLVRDYMSRGRYKPGELFK
jgi:hypothetical protein